MLRSISFNASVTNFESGFIGATIINLTLVRFLCNLGVEYLFESFLFSCDQWVTSLNYIFLSTFMKGFNFLG